MKRLALFMVLLLLLVFLTACGRTSRSSRNEEIDDYFKYAGYYIVDEDTWLEIGGGLLEADMYFSVGGSKKETAKAVSDALKVFESLDPQ